MRHSLSRVLATSALAFGATACNDSNDTIGTNQPTITARNTSVTPDGSFLSERRRSWNRSPTGPPQG